MTGTVIACRHYNRLTSTSISVSDPTTVMPAVEVLIRAVAMAVARRCPGVVGEELSQAGDCAPR